MKCSRESLLLGPNGRFGSGRDRPCPRKLRRPRCRGFGAPPAASANTEFDRLCRDRGSCQRQWDRASLRRVRWQPDVDLIYAYQPRRKPAELGRQLRTPMRTQLSDRSASQQRQLIPARRGTVSRRKGNGTESRGKYRYEISR